MSPRGRRRRTATRGAPLLLAVLVAACSFGGSGGSATASAGSGDTACGEVTDGLRTVEHAKGSTEVSADPQRVVLLDTGEMDAAAAVGVAPVGVVGVGDQIDLPPHVAEAVGSAQRVGTIAQPDLEAIAALQPDLILGNTTRDDAIYPQLVAIAPTVLGGDIGPEWRDNFVLYSTAMGRCQEADARLADYDAQVAELQEALGPDRGDTTVSVVRALYGTVRVYHRASFVGAILDEVGLGRPAAQSDDVLMKEVGLESIPSMDGDVMFIAQWGPVQPLFQLLQDKPAWSDLTAVRSDRVYEVDDSTWMLGLGVLGASAVLEDLHRDLVG